MLLQFHVKLADALRAVQSSEVGEDPTKAEGAMNMLDEFQQSIGMVLTHRFSLAALLAEKKQL
jgi:hypothetical protein